MRQLSAKRSAANISRWRMTPNSNRISISRQLRDARPVPGPAYIAGNPITTPVRIAGGYDNFHGEVESGVLDGLGGLGQLGQLLALSAFDCAPGEGCGLAPYPGYMPGTAALAGLGWLGANEYKSGYGRIATAATGATLPTALTALGVSVPVIGPIVAGVAIGLQALLSRQRGARKVETTEIVNGVEPYLQQNVEGYLSEPRTPQSQQAALVNFDQGWAHVEAACGRPEMGKPGQWCINDREPGGKWDWFARYRKPIEDAAPQYADPGIAQTLGAGLQELDPETGLPVQAPGALGDNSALLLLGAGALALYLWG